MLAGNFNLSADGLMILLMGKGPIKWGASLLDSVNRGIFLAENQTNWPDK